MIKQTKTQSRSKVRAKLGPAKVLVTILTLSFFICHISNAQTSRDKTIISTAEDRHDLSMTVYQNGLAMVQDARKVNLLEGTQMLAFENVSNQLIPASALFSGTNITVLQQVFDYALMSTENMLRLSTGKPIKLITDNIKTGETATVDAVIISTVPQLVVQTKEGIQTNPSGAITFLEMPEGLSKSPALKLFLETAKTGEQQVDLTYLTDGLSWKADYIAKLNFARTKMLLRAFATVTNNTEIGYQNMSLSVVAGNVPRNLSTLIHAKSDIMSERAYKASTPLGAPVSEVLGNVQLFKLPTKVSIESQQTRQFPLLFEVELDVKEIMTASHYFYGQQERFDVNHIERPKVEVQFKNTTKSPLPAGEFRIYEVDSSQKDHLTGELKITDNAENETINLQLSEAYNLKVIRKQLHWEPILNFKQKNIGGTAKYEITITNAGEKEHSVNLLEMFNGSTVIDEESIKSTKPNSTTISWILNVPAKGEAKLRYTISTRER